MEKKLLLSLAAASLLATGMGYAARSNDACAVTPPAACNQEDCNFCYCLGPDNYGVNAPACPITCNGDWLVSVEGFYWNAHQDGMEYAVENGVTNPDISFTTSTIPAEIQELNNIIDGHFENPNNKWDFGFKLGLGFCTTCDGWDFGVRWTWYQGRANGQVEAEIDDNRTLMPLWSAFASVLGGPVYATDIEHDWKLELNLIDIELGRNFWTSKYLSIRPHVGLRIAFIDQDYNLRHRGGSWSALIPEMPGLDPEQPAMNGFVNMENNFDGVGVRAGLDSTWNFGCGWALYGSMATSIVYGRFDIDYDEFNRVATSPHDKLRIAAWNDSFRASRVMLDLGVGIQWTTMFCDCQYGLTVALGWEHHTFFDQNQFWRTNRIGDLPNTVDNGNLSNGVTNNSLPNNTGENVFNQRRGDLDTQGWTLSVHFAF